MDGLRGSNPMEKGGAGRVDTNKPGIYMSDYGSGRLVHLPWDFGDLYFRFSSVGHAALRGGVRQRGTASSFDGVASF